MCHGHDGRDRERDPRHRPDADEDPTARGRISRRGFLTSLGGGTVAASAAGKLLQPAPSDAAPAAATAASSDMVKLTLTINGRRHRLLVQPRWSLLHVLREQLGLTATKVGCDRGECGACTVLIDGRPRYACMILALEAELGEITTLEGLLRGEELGDVQQAFVDEDAFQCGYCTPGQVMAVEGLLRANPDPSNDEIRTAVSGNLCRCGSYRQIARAAHRAAELRGAAPIEGGGS